MKRPADVVKGVAFPMWIGVLPQLGLAGNAWERAPRAAKMSIATTTRRLIGSRD